MSEEEKKAIDYYTINEYSFGFEIDCDIESFKKAIGIEETDEDTFEKHQIRFKTLLNLIEKQQKEIENLLQAYKQDEKIIQEMAEFIYGNDTIFYLPKDVNTKQEVIDYFRKRCKQ